MSKRSVLLVAGVAVAGAAAIAIWRAAATRFSAIHGQASRSIMDDAAGYDRGAQFLRFAYDRIARDVAADAPAGRAVLDVGCGPGQLAILLAARRPDLSITGADLDPAMVSRAQANAARRRQADGVRLDGPTFVVGDVACLPFPEGTFDLIVSTFSMHHWADRQAGLRDLHRVLKPGGRLLIWDVAGPILRFETGGSVPADPTDGSPFGPGSIGGRWGIGPITLAKRYDLRRTTTVDAQEGAGG